MNLNEMLSSLKQSHIKVTKQGCEQLLNRLTESEKSLLQYWARSILWEPVSFRDLEEGTSDHLTGLELKAALIGLRKKGVVFALRKLWGELLYILPIDVALLWHKILIPDPELSQASPFGTLEVKVTHEATPGLAYDLFHLLTFVDQTPFSLTQKGTIHKRQVAKCSEGFRLQSTHLQQATIRYLDQQAYPKHFAVVYDFALRLGLVQRTAGTVQCAQNVVGEWLEQTPEEASNSLFKQWFKVHLPSQPWLQHVLVYLLRSPRQEWVPVASIQQWMSEHRLGDDFSSTTVEEELFLPLSGFGWLDIGTVTGEKVVRWKGPSWKCVLVEADDIADGDQDQQQRDPLKDRFYVQPNFEVLIPPTARFQIRWTMEQFAQFRSSDQMAVYALSKESIHRAAERNWSGQEIIDFLRENSLYELPDNVAQSILQWRGQYGRVSLIDAVVLRCADEALATELEKQRKLGELLIEKISPTHFLIAREDAKQCLQLLDQHGYAPRKQVETLQKRPDQGHRTHTTGIGSERSRQGIIQPTFVYSSYALDPTIPELEDVVPLIKKLPVSWTQDYRSYHLSTLTEMIRQAVDLKTQIRLGVGDRDELVQPLQLKQQEDGSWCIVGVGRNRQKQNISLEKIGSIQIVIPS